METAATNTNSSMPLLTSTLSSTNTDHSKDPVPMLYAVMKRCQHDLGSFRLVFTKEKYYKFEVPRT
jgi:hypothetical protein